MGSNNIYEKIRIHILRYETLRIYLQVRRLSYKPFNLFNMKRLTILLFTCFCLQYPQIQAQQTSVQLKFQINQVYYLVSFVEAASGNHLGSKHLRRIYEASAYNTTDNRQILNRFKKLNLNIITYKYPNYPKRHLTSTSIWDLFKIAASQAHSLTDLKQRTSGMYPADIQTAMFRVFNQMTPIFEKLLWEPLIKDARTKLKALEHYAQQSQIQEKFQKIARFYGSHWNSDLPFVINFLPLPASYRRGSSARFKGNMLTCDFPLAMKNQAIFLGIIVHELSHILYERQPIVLQKQIERWFLDNTLDNRQFAYQWINEALATACGNAWFFKQLTDSLEKGPWYGNRYIDRFAQSLFPEVSRYVTQGKSIDSAFVKYSIQLFSKAFPNALYEYNQWMNDVLVLHDLDQQQIPQLDDPLYENFRVTKNHSLSPITDLQQIKKLTQSISTNLIVITKNHQQVLHSLQKQLEGLNKYDLKPAKNFLLTYIKKNKVPVIVVNIQQIKHWKKAVIKLRKLKIHDPKQPYIRL